MLSPSNAESERSDAACRRFTLLDAMVIIAAIGPCLMVPRLLLNLTSNFDPLNRAYSVQYSMQTYAGSWLLIASATLALLVILSPRACGRERYHKPGALAMFMVIMTWFFNEFQAVVYEANFWLYPERNLMIIPYALTFPPIAQTTSHSHLAILASWITLAMNGDRKPGRDWLDRSAYVLGWTWIIWGVFTQYIVCWVVW